MSSQQIKRDIYGEPETVFYSVSSTLDYTHNPMDHVKMQEEISSPSPRESRNIGNLAHH